MTMGPEVDKLLRPPVRESGFENSKHAWELSCAFNFSVTVKAGKKKKIYPASGSN
jgi:hypothetical protein